MNLKSIFDKIVILNLDRRTDRLALISENLRAINLSIDDCERFSAVDALKLKAVETRDCKIKTGAYACNLSYLKIFENFLLTEMETLIVLEDDCAFLKDFDYTIFNEIPKSWELLYFGANNNIQPKHFNDKWNKVVKSYSSHMIAYSRKAILFIINYLLRDEIIKQYEYDIILHRFIQCQNCYISKTMYSYQINTFSDIEMKRIDYSWMLR